MYFVLSFMVVQATEASNIVYALSLLPPSLSPLHLCLLLSTSLTIRHHLSCSPFHTFIQSVCGLCFPPPPHGSLFFF